MNNPNRKRTSYLWAYFSVKNSANKLASCDLCGQLLTYKTTISNLKKHLERRHPVVKLSKDAKSDDCSNLSDGSPSPSVFCVLGECQVEETSDTPSGKSARNLQQKTNLPAKEQPSSKEISQSMKNKLDTLLLQLFIHDYQPFSVVEDEGFVNFVTGLNPSYKLPNRKIITNCMLPAKYEVCLSAVHAELLSVNSVCLSSDTWTSVNLESYLTVIAHYITESFELRSILLECSPIPVSHTSADLAELIHCITEKFHLTDKVGLIVSRCDTNMKDAVTKELKKEPIECFAHTLNLILQEALKIPKVLLDKIESIIRYFKKNSSSLEAENMTLDVEIEKLIQDVPTRWNSTFYNTERFFEQQDSIKTITESINKDLPILTEDEWTACKELSTVLETFEDLTKNIIGEDYITGSLIIPLTNSLMSVCEEIQKEKFGVIAKSVIDELLKGINTRLSQIEENKSLALATFLDPRFKLAPFSSELFAQSVKEYCISLLTHILDQKQQKIKEEMDTDDQYNQDANSSKSSAGQPVKYSVWDSLDNIIASKKSSSGPKVSPGTIEVNLYIEDAFLDRKKDPLLWWQNNQHNFPLMAKLVKTKFNVMGTSVPCERLFSKASNLITECNKAKHVEKLLFLNFNSFLVN